MAIEIKYYTQGITLLPVKANEDVLLSITIGNAQIGSSFVEDENGISIASGTISNLCLGEGACLVGKAYKIITNVFDINPSSAKTTVYHRFTNANIDFTYSDEIPPRGILVFQINYRFLLQKDLSIRNGSK